MKKCTSSVKPTQSEQSQFSEGNITLELSNVANLPIRLYPGMKVGQISFFAMSTPADRPYGHPGLGSKYKGQSAPTASRMHLNFPDTAPKDTE